MTLVLLILVCLVKPARYILLMYALLASCSKHNAVVVHVVIAICQSWNCLVMMTSY